MKILVVGTGGREHAIVKKIKENKEVTEIFCAAGNGGMALDGTCLDIKATDVEGVVKFAQENAIDYVVVAPDDPLAMGMVDALEKVGIPAFGPNAAAARIESSKVFSKDLMRKYGIPTAAYESFDDMEKALAYLDEITHRVVIKADGLALGKGVIIPETKEEAKAAVKSMMQDKIFGNSGNSIVIEEFLTGVEVSVLAFTDGKCVKPMVSSMDHKRALDGDKGLNTGGMGTIAPNPYYTEEKAKESMEKIFLPTLKAMENEGCPFKGCLYFGLIMCEDAVKVIEYNCRFGDPETQVVLPLLKTDLLEIMKATTFGTLENQKIEWDNGAAACVIIASGGYPESYEKGKVMEIPEMDSFCYHAGTKLEDGKFYTNGGRVLGISAKGETLKVALEKAYADAEKVKFEGAFMRHDIGHLALKILEEQNG